MAAQDLFIPPSSASTQHIKLVRSVCIKSQSDQRFAGFAVGGSWAYNRMDQWSDLDLNLVVYPQYFLEIVNQAGDLARNVGALLSFAQGRHTGEPRLFNGLYGPPLLHVDFKFFSLPDFAVRVEEPMVIWERDLELSSVLKSTRGSYPKPDQQWLEDQFWIWIHYGINKIERGELLEVVDHLGFLRNQVLGPLLSLRNNQEPRRIRHAEQKLPSELYLRLKKTLSSPEPIELLMALLEATNLYRELRNSDAIVLRSDAEKMVFSTLLRSLED